jgi:hypothetical protein
MYTAIIFFDAAGDVLLSEKISGDKIKINLLKDKKLWPRQRI